MVPASDGSAYREYELTKQGEDLLPALVALRQWGEKYMFGRGDDHSVMRDARNPSRWPKMVEKMRGVRMGASLVWRIWRLWRRVRAVPVPKRV